MVRIYKDYNIYPRDYNSMGMKYETMGINGRLMASTLYGIKILINNEILKNR